MKYEDEYFRTKNKEEFVELASKYYNNIQKQTLIRRYYDLRKKYGEQRGQPQVHAGGVGVVEIPHKPIGDDDPAIEPSIQKKLMLEDMKKMGYKLEYNFLKRYGFTKPEINWLVKNGELK